jgi:uncharacterized OsmC-like protein
MIQPCNQYPVYFSRDGERPRHRHHPAAAMMADKPAPGTVLPALQTLRCHTVATGAFKQLNYVRSLPPLRVEERFGPPDGAPAATPSETLLTALGSCLSARIHANAISGSVVVHSLEVDVEVDVAASPMWDHLPGQAPGRIGFEAIRVAVHIQADASLEALRALVAHAVLWSPIANTLHDPVHLDVALGRTARVAATWPPAG